MALPIKRRPARSVDPASGPGHASRDAHRRRVVIRVFALPGPSVFRLLIAVLLLPLGLWLCARTLRPAPGRAGEPSARTVTGLALGVGMAGGIYGIGGRGLGALYAVHVLH